MDRIIQVLFLLLFIGALYIAYFKVMDFITTLTAFTVSYEIIRPDGAKEIAEMVVYAYRREDIQAVLNQYMRYKNPSLRLPPNLLEVVEKGFEEPGVVKFTNRPSTCTAVVGECFYTFKYKNTEKFVKAPCRPPITGLVETIIYNTFGTFDEAAVGEKVVFTGCNRIA
jgi:hypothetical protein